MCDEILIENWKKQEFNREMINSENNWLHEQVNFLQQELSTQLKENQALKEELAYTNEELVNIVQENQALKEELACTNEELVNLVQENRQIIDAKQLTFKEANKLAKLLLANEVPTEEALAILLDTVYNQKVSSSELEKKQETVGNCDSSDRDRLDVAAKTLVPRAPSNKLITLNSIRSLHQDIATKCNQLHDRYIELGTQFVMFKSHLRNLQTELTNRRRMRKEDRQQRLRNTQQSQEIEMNTPDFPPRLFRDEAENLHANEKVLVRLVT